MKIQRSCLIGLLAFCITIFCFTHAGAQKEEMRVLFIGNSLTYTNDLPAIVEALAEATQEKRFVYQSIVYPDVSLEDQWKRGEAKKIIASKKWDVVVLQQGPSALEESRKLLLEYTRLFDKEIRATGAKTALYTVWPAAARLKDFDRVVESYKLAAEDVKGILFPVGEAWREAWKKDSKLDLYSKDLFHPSIAGSYLAALVIYEKLYGKSPVGLPAYFKIRSKTLDKIELPEEEARTLQIAAAETNKRY